jgi:hypothetical protein
MLMYSYVSMRRRVKVTCLYVISLLFTDAVSRPDYTFESLRRTGTVIKVAVLTFSMKYEYVLLYTDMDSFSIQTSSGKS